METPTLQASVIICTRNRSKQLRSVLESLADMDRPEDSVWELLIVDNGSTDDTPAVIDAYRGTLPIRRVEEPRPGLSNARNRGVANAAGAYICWTDDDVKVDRRWLREYLDAFSRHPDGVYFGGTVDPVLEGSSRPEWFEQNPDLLDVILAKRHPDVRPEGSYEMGKDLPFGANFAVRAAEQKGALYNPELGVSSEFRRLGEETAVLRALRDAGAKGFWVPGSRVKHYIPQARQTLAYILTYQKSAGETWAVLSRMGKSHMGEPIPEGGRRMAGVPVWLVRKTARAWAQYQSTRYRKPSSRWLAHFMAYGYYRGAAEYLYREHQKKN